MSSDARRVAPVAYPGVQPLDVVGLAEVLAPADRVVGGRGYALTIAAPDGRSARSDPGLWPGADCTLDRNTQVMPWRIEDALKALGPNDIQAGLWKGFASRDGGLITGQQNFSASETAQLLIEAVRR